MGMSKLQYHQEGPEFYLEFRHCKLQTIVHFQLTSQSSGRILSILSDILALAVNVQLSTKVSCAHPWPVSTGGAEWRAVTDSSNCSVLSLRANMGQLQQRGILLL